MRESTTAAPSGDRAIDPQTRRLVLGAGLLMVILHLVHRAWVAYGGWFYADDYTLLVQARDQDLDGAYLTSTYSGHLLPAGRLIAWVVSNTGALNWPLAATITLAVELLTCLAALWMLTTVFGARWGVLAPLALYLTTAITLPAYIWWGAALLQQATQLAFFLAVGAWVRYLRDRRLGWALAAYAAVGVGVASDVKALVVLPVLAYLALAYFAEGSPWRRVWGVLRSYWAAATVGLALVAAYVVIFFSVVDDAPAERPPLDLAGEVLAGSAGEALPVALLGGPWRWDQHDVQPTQSADAPAWAVSLSWVLLAVVVVYAVLRRHRTLRAWGLLLLAYALDLGLLLVARATAFGPGVGHDYRFFTDLAPGAALAVALAFLELPGSRQGSRERLQPLTSVRVGRRAVAALVAVVCALGVVSQTVYTRTFHGAQASKDYMQTLERGLDARGKVDLVDQELPEAVSPALFAPYNRVSVMTGLISDQVSFPEASSDLAVVAADGTLHQADLAVHLDSEPGPREGCGWLIRSRGLDVPLSGDAIDFVWWMRIGYLSGADSPVTVSAGESSVETTVQRGLGELWVRVTGAFDRVRISGLDAGATMCVDTIELGQPEPGGFL